MFLFSYFTEDDEALHLATSEDGYVFSPLADGRPIVRSTVGARSIRDPFIGRDPKGGFHLLGTDSWNSFSAVYSHSEDLVAWTDPVLIPLMADIPGARNTWAPEWFVQPDGTFRLVWSSVCDTETDGAVDYSNLREPQTIWSAVTSDFSEFGPSTPFFAPGFSVIDASMQQVGDNFVMCFKDEREHRDDLQPTKNLYSTVWNALTGEFGEILGPISPPRVEGPAWLRRGDQFIIAYDYFMDGGYGASSSADLTSWWTSGITVPAGARHGAFLEISAEEASRLKRVFDSGSQRRAATSERLI